MPEPADRPGRRTSTSLVELVGVNFVNKGAELMLRSVLAALQGSELGLVPAVALRHGTFAQRNQLGIRHLLRLGGAKTANLEEPLVAMTRWLPRSDRLPFGFVREDDVRVVLDASGFAYSDQWGPLMGRANARHVRRWKRPGRRFVLLPQAFGPFEHAEVRSSMLELLELADLVYARDRESLDHLQKLGGRRDHVRLAPDFTNVLEVGPELAHHSARLHGHVVFIPNLRMVDKGGVDGVERYVQRMSALIERVRSSGYVCSILVHETKDEDVARQIGKAVGNELQVVTIADPVVIKATLAGARLVVSSRFHGLVSALAQAVPAVGIGWSHKYAELMRDYGALDCLGSSLGADGDVADIVLRELGDAEQRERRSGLRERSAGIKLESRRMWADVFELISS